MFGNKSLRFSLTDSFEVNDVLKLMKVFEVDSRFRHSQESLSKTHKQPLYCEPDLKTQREQTQTTLSKISNKMPCSNYQT